MRDSSGGIGPETHDKLFRVIYGEQETVLKAMFFRSTVLVIPINNIFVLVIRITNTADHNTFNTVLPIQYIDKYNIFFTDYILFKKITSLRV